MEYYAIYPRNLSQWRSPSRFPTEDRKGELSALKVNLHLCIYTYNTAVKSGVTATEEVSRSNSSGWELSEPRNVSVVQGEKNFTIMTDLRNVSIVQGEETFTIYQQDVLGFNNYLSSQTFVGSAGVSVSGSFDYDTDTATVLATSIYDEPGGMEGLSRSMENFAITLTNALRTTSDFVDTHPGTASTSEVYIHIAWVWMIVPIAGVLLSFVFLLLTRSLTKQHNLPVLKSSLLAAMLGVDVNTRRELGGITTLAAMEKEAGKRRVHLESDGCEWHIVKGD